MSSFRNIDVKAPHILELQHAIQLELANRDYSSEDDPVMAEYIVVMLANQKTPDQITAEMKDLIGAEYDPAFTEWIWTATQSCLDRHTAAQASTSGTASTSAPPVATDASDFSARTRNTRHRRSRSPEASGSASRAREQRRSRSPNATRGGETRRSRSRSPSTWGRGERARRDYSSHEAFEASVRPPKGNEPFDGRAYWRQKAEERRRNPPPPVNRDGSSQIFQAAYGRALRNGSASTAVKSERELFPSSDTNDTPPPPYEETGGVSIFGRAGIPDPRAAAFVPASATPLPSNPTDAPAASTSASIFSRIDPMLPNNPAPTPTLGADATPTHSSDFPTVPTETSICRWNVGCTNPMCPYSHASPSNAGPGGDPNALVLSQQNCRYGAKCTNKDCTRSHVSPAVARIQARTAAPVSFAPAPAVPAVAATLSLDTALPSQTASRPCRFGAACTRADCFFSHPSTRTLAAAAGSSSSAQTPCRFGLGCTRPDCYFAHPPGQRASASSGGTSQRLHVFAENAAKDEEMEVIIPGVKREEDASEPVKSEPAPISLST